MFSAKKVERKSLVERAGPSLMPLFVLITLGVEGFLVLCVLGLYVTVINLSSQSKPTYVVDEAGNTYPVKTAKGNQPTPQEVQTFAAETVDGLFNWKAVLSEDKAQKMKIDPGIPIKRPNGGEPKIPTAMWEMSFRLDDPFRKEFIGTLADRVPQEIFQATGAQGFFLLEHVDPPEQVKQGQWKVRVQGILRLFTGGDNLGDGIPIRYEVFLREVNGFRTNEKGIEKAISTAKAETEKVKHIPANDLQKVVYKSSERFKIITMREFE